MKKYLTTTALTLTALTLSTAAQAQDDSCGEVSITEMGWASASVVTNVADFILTQGYGCDVTVVPSDTIPAMTSVAENGDPDIVTELWINGAGAAYDRLTGEGNLIELGSVLEPGGIDGWYVPAYLVEEHPELATIDGILENPELVGGRFHNCPEGWGCRTINDNMLPVFGVEEAGIEIFDHGSGETLATSIAAAYEDHEPWFGYYWAPTAVLGKYDMVRVDMGEFVEESYEAAQDEGATGLVRSSYPPAPVKTAVTDSFQEEHPELADFLSKMSFPVDDMNDILRWMDENSASGEEGAVYFLTSQPDVWATWLDDAARERLAAVLQ
ncbi:glycine/betaine ABC transporter substrate-binding protein [Salipiger sp. CCB-MM3]|uniref:ABC transporter substrate-binding protein n=1 Tax=Salipiger sp. CCB-MM3 TaxID=1792508 RepID=UPI00080A965C|nr:ABC transporter substrate-binding protein [Salipiger sp. CCB-MM3]ANT62122.1 glycine/betaine ABC transporter substrate-binding protein [Salipiger sp. CCB-MM3]